MDLNGQPAPPLEATPTQIVQFCGLAAGASGDEIEVSFAVKQLVQADVRIFRDLTDTASAATL